MQNKNYKRYDKNGARLFDGEGQRKEGYYYFRWTEEGVRQPPIYANDLKTLREKEKPILKRLANGLSSGRKTVDDIFEDWYSLKHVKKSTKGGYLYTYEHFIKANLGNRKLETVKEHDIKRFYCKLLDEGVIGRGISIATLENVNSLLYQLFRKAVRNQYIGVNPVEDVLKDIKQERHYKREKKSALTVAQETRFLTYLKETPRVRYWYPMFEVYFGIGGRIGEETALCWEDVDLKAKTIKIDKTLKYIDRTTNMVSRYMDTTKTTYSVRTIAICDAVVEALIEQKNGMQMLGRKSKISVDGYSNFVFLTNNGTPYNDALINQTIKRLVRDCNKIEVLEAFENGREPVIVPVFSTHTARRTFCTRYVENEPNLAIVASYVGHNGTRTLMEHYVDIQNSAMQDSITRVGANILPA